ncbi:MAG: thioredoxin [Fimbriiglobus sp.]|jgi:thioredoxin 1|nr:thioredoxin [Fimbriiglobus sp.]
MAIVKKVTTEDFGYQVLNAAEPVVVDLYADWCGPCRALAPLLDRFAQHYSGKVMFVKVNVDDEPQVASYYDVASIPTLLVFDRGQIVHRSSGMPDPQGFVALLDRIAGRSVGR